jgi:hypothetical protein
LYRTAATKGQAPPPISLFFDVASKFISNKGTSHCVCKHSVGRLQKTHRGDGAMIRGRRCLFHGERAKPLDRVVVAAHVDCCVLCV